MAQAYTAQKSAEAQTTSATDCCTAGVASRAQLLQSTQSLLLRPEAAESSHGARWALVQLAQQDYKQPWARSLGLLPTGSPSTHEQLGGQGMLLVEDQEKPFVEGQKRPLVEDQQRPLVEDQEMLEWSWCWECGSGVKWQLSRGWQ